jgi:single-strand DNA-binding protein
MIVATVVGNIGKDAELRHAGDTPVCSFSVASNRKVKGEDETTWCRVSVWGKRGETLSQYLTKGKKVVVVGELSTRDYDGKTYIEIRADQVEFAGAANGAQREAPTAASSRAAVRGDAYEGTDDDINF